jgi:hypothetical protein
MKMSFLHDLPLMEALEINPLEIEAFIKENNLEDIASVKDGVLHIWRYRIPLVYKKGGALPAKYLFALSKLFKLVDSMSSKRYKDLFDIAPEEANALKNLILKAVMPHDKARELATSLTKNPEKKITAVYGAYKRIDSDVDIMQLPKNLALLLSTAISIRTNKRYNPLGYEMPEDEGRGNERNTIEKKLEELKKLSSHTKRFDLFKTAVWHILKHRGGYYDRIDIDHLDKIAMKIFLKLEDVESAGWSPDSGISIALDSLSELRNIKSVAHLSTIPSNFWRGIRGLVGDFQFRINIPNRSKNDVVEWWVKHPEAKGTLISDTLAMAVRYEQTIKFVNRDLASLQAEHDELVELSHKREKKQTFDNDILPEKDLAPLKVEYLNNTYDLKYEGKVLHHCVGSYSDDCVSGRSVVYRIYWNKKHVGTLELGSKDHGITTIENAFLRQAYGPFNRALSKEINQAVANLLNVNKDITKRNHDLSNHATAAQQRSLRKNAALPAEKEEEEEEEIKFDLENCYECGSFNTQEMRDGMHCQDCGEFTPDKELNL